MSINRRWVAAVMRKELREYRRNRSIVAAVAIFPLIFLIQPLAAVFVTGRLSADALGRMHLLLYMLAVPVLSPSILAAYSVTGERQQGSLEPILTTPIRREEFLLGKAAAALAPSTAVAYLVYATFLALVWIFADHAVALAILQPADIAVQVATTPLLATLAIWIGIGISTRVTDVRVAQQLSLLGALPIVVVTSLTAFDVIHATQRLAILGIVALVLADVTGWRIVAPLFDRERLIAGSRS